MNLRSKLQQQAARHQLDETALARLNQLAGLDKEPLQVVARWRTGCAVTGAALVGVGIIQWIAANWSVFGRFGRIGLAELFVLAPMLTLIWRPAWRVPMGIIAILGSGATLACIGQTYPTGAEPWQLFALWAILNAPFCYAIRSDALWVLWAIITNTATTLVIQQNARTWGDSDATALYAQLMALGVIAAIAALFRLPLRDMIGSGKWTAACSLLLATLSVCSAMIRSLGSHQTAPYWFGLALQVVACRWLSSKRYLDTFGLCIILLAINVELDAGFVDAALRGNQQLISLLFGISFAATGILAGSISYVRWVLTQVKEPGDE